MQSPAAAEATAPSTDERPLGGWDFVLEALRHWKLLLLGSLLCGLAVLGLSYAIQPTFTARTTFLPPQPPQNNAAAALASLGALGNLAGVTSGTRVSADLYAGLLASRLVRDKLADEFKLADAYGLELRDEVLDELGRRIRITVGRKDGLIAVEVDDTSPQRAAAMANRHVDELRRVTSQFALSEAQQRRAFFERELAATRQRLAAAQAELQASGFNESTLRAEPRAASENYARLRAETMAAQVRLQALRQTLTDETPEVQRQLSTLGSMRAQLDKMGSAVPSGSGPEYIGRYREFKYQETLFELFARQFELARLDEAREGAGAQTVDVAQVPQRKSKPRRALLAVTATLASGVAIALWLALRLAWRRLGSSAAGAPKAQRLRAALGRPGA